MISPPLLTLLLAVLAWQPACADPLYKWVDSEGRVTYSSTPPPAGAKAEKVEVAPPPSAEDIWQAEERAKRIEAQAEGLTNQRLEQEAEERAREAEEARRREAEQAKRPVVIEKPVYVPQPLYYPPPRKPPPPRPPKPPPQPPIKPLPSPMPTN